jgi:hypothetical protein
MTQAPFDKPEKPFTFAGRSLRETVPSILRDVRPSHFSKRVGGVHLGDTPVTLFFLGGIDASGQKA